MEQTTLEQRLQMLQSEPTRKTRLTDAQMAETFQALADLGMLSKLPEHFAQFATVLSSMGVISLGGQQ